MMDGICTLANDRVLDQLIALLNSIETHAPGTPVCVYPYNDNLERVRAEIARRPMVQLYEDQASIQAWDQFFMKVWDSHATAKTYWKSKGSTTYHRFGAHRRFCAFDGPFDRFLYMDADTLLLNSVKSIFQYLETCDWLVYDFQHKDVGHVYAVDSPLLHQVFPPEKIASEIFCSGFYATKRGIFPPEKLDFFLKKLAEGEANILYLMSADQPILNYMAMRSNLKICNLALTLPPDQITGCCVTSSHFQEQDGILYDKGNRLTYLHYIGISSTAFTRLSQGENLDFPYRDIFLHYRYLREPEYRPVFATKPKPYNAPPGLFKRALRKLKLVRFK